MIRKWMASSFLIMLDGVSISQNEEKKDMMIM